MSRINYTLNKNTFTYIILGWALLMLISCKKDWLEAKPQLNLVVPTTIEDYQAILDNTTTSTGPSAVGGDVGFNVDQTVLNEISAGDFSINAANFDASDGMIKDAYTWSPTLFSTVKTVSDWNISYKKILYTNIILEGIEKIQPTDGFEQTGWNQVKGSALFFRAYTHYEVAQEFCEPFDPSTAATGLGIPLRVTSNTNVAATRSTIKQTYDQIVSDLRLARTILPVELPNSKLAKLRPTKSAATAMLARVYLAMNNYDSALYFANETLDRYDSLLDYNSDIHPVGTFYRLPRFNKETIFHTKLLSSSTLGVIQAIVEPDLLSQYDANDLRKTAFFRLYRGATRFTGSYDEGEPFSGLATDEIYLIRAECHARKGTTTLAMDDLNKLLEKRWVSGMFVPFTATTPDEALEMVVKERRKELCFRGLRWSDLRRLNKESRFAVTLTRTVNGQTFTLPPNDNRYVMPIPPDVIQLGGLEQNPR